MDWHLLTWNGGAFLKIPDGFAVSLEEPASDLVNEDG
jgi:hypothetical protein